MNSAGINIATIEWFLARRYPDAPSAVRSHAAEQALSIALAMYPDMEPGRRARLALGIARNVFRQSVREDLRRRAHAPAIAEVSRRGLHDARSDPVEAVERREQISHVLKLLAAHVEPMDRQLLMLITRGMTVRSASELLGIPEHAAYRRYLAALRFLADAMRS
jgi:DNA-directed RNA polymerase specialized sigma24 family protein